MRRGLAILAVLVAPWVASAGALCGARAETVAALPAPSGYVDDYAGVISGDAKTELEKLCREVHDKTRAQIFLVTVKTLQGAAAETFANQLFPKWKIGEKKTDRGILVLLAIEDRKRWIEVGYGLGGVLNDAKVGDIGREMVPALQAANYDDAARIGVNAVARVVAADAGVTLDDEAPPEAEPVAAPAVQQQALDNPLWIQLGFPTLFFGVIGVIAVLKARDLRRGLGQRRPGGFPGFVPGGMGDGMSSDSSSFSGDSGGSSDSFSGGDGGSSGGGGAGGDW